MRRWLPLRLAPGEFRRWDIDMNAPRRSIDTNPVAVLHQGERSTHRCLWASVSNAHTARCPRKPPIGEQRDLFPHTLAIEQGSNAEHFAHPRSPFGAFIADDDD